MTDLADFLLARIAEDEEWARPASGILGMDVAWHQPDVLHQRGINRADSHHIARWDPARVLAECDAKRRIVEFMVNEVKDARRRPGWTMPDEQIDEEGRKYRAGVENQKAKQLPDALDRTDRLLRLLALPYADHPDYREEWKP